MIICFTVHTTVGSKEPERTRIFIQQGLSTRHSSNSAFYNNNNIICSLVLFSVRMSVSKVHIYTYGNALT